MTPFLYYNKQPCETRKAVSDCQKTDYYQIHTDKHIANTAENIFRTDKALIIS
jgi:hypothetical protein